MLKDIKGINFNINQQNRRLEDIEARRSENACVNYNAYHKH